MGRRKEKKRSESLPVEREQETRKEVLKQKIPSASESRVSTSNASTVGSSRASDISSSNSSTSSSGEEEEDRNNDAENFSLTSRTFDLREFGEPELARSSSPSVADTIIARGVEYPRYLPAGTGLPSNNKIHPPVHNGPPPSGPSPILQPEEFLNPTTRQLMAEPRQNHHHQQQQQQQRHEQVYRSPAIHSRHHPNHHVEFSSVPQLARTNGYAKSNSLDDFDSYRQGPPYNHHHDPHQVTRLSLPQNGMQNYYYEGHRNNEAHPNNEAHHNNEAHEKRKKKKIRKIIMKKPTEPSLSLGEILSGSLLGDAPVIKDFLGKRQRNYLWSPVIFFECFFRSIGAVVFASNPLSGLLIFLAMLSVIPLPTLVGSLTLIASILTGVFLVQIRLDSIRTGGVTFNGFLLGVVIGQFADLMCPWTYVAAILSGFFVIYLYCAFEGLLKALQLPLLNSPFNLAAFIFFTSGIADILKAETSGGRSAADDSFHGVDFRRYGNVTFDNATTIRPTTESAPQALLTFPMIIDGAIFSTAQIFGTKNGTATFFVCAAIFICSPILCAQAAVGAFIGTLIGVGLDEAPYTAVATGGWAYNSLLTSAAVGGFFIVLSIQSWILSVIGSVLSALVFGAMLKADMPALGVPFMLVTWLMVACTNVNSSLTTGLPNGARGSKKWMAMVRVSEHLIQTPEVHLQQFWKREPHRRRKVNPHQGPSSDDRYNNTERETELHL